MVTNAEHQYRSRQERAEKAAYTKKRNAFKATIASLRSALEKHCKIAHELAKGNGRMLDSKLQPLGAHELAAEHAKFAMAANIAAEIYCAMSTARATRDMECLVDEIVTALVKREQDKLAVTMPDPEAVAMRDALV